MIYKKKALYVKIPVLIGVHKVRGDKLAIKFLQDTHPKYADSLFFFAKKYGQTEFNWSGDDYEIKCEKDLCFLVIRLTTDEEKEIKNC
jgi:hypothetical protein